MGQLLLQQADDLDFRKVGAVAHVWGEDGGVRAQPGCAGSEPRPTCRVPAGWLAGWPPPAKHRQGSRAFGSWARPFFPSLSLAILPQSPHTETQTVAISPRCQTSSCPSFSTQAIPSTEDFIFTSFIHSFIRGFIHLHYLPRIHPNIASVPETRETQR